MWCQMGTKIRMAGRGLLAATALAGLACLGVAAPATASSLAVPRIHSFSPRAGAAGTKVTITGSRFTSVRTVRFGGVAAAFKVRSRSRITAAVPAMPSGAGRITVATRAGTATSRARFTVTPRIVLSPVTGPPGSTGFRATEGVDIFAGTTDEALAGTGPAGSFGPIRVTIPASAAPGTAWISAEGRRSRLFAQAAFTVNTNWAQFRYSATHTGINPVENMLSRSSVARLGLDWSFRTGGGVFSSPAVAGGVLYIGAEDGHVYALNAATGAKRWSFPAGTDSSPAVANGVVYIGSGNMYALNAATGARRWTFPAGGIDDSSPAVANGVVYIGSDNGHVYALNAATGDKRWSFHTGGFLFSSPAVVNGVVYIGSGDSDGDGNVYALDAGTGAQRWSFPTGAVVLSSPAVANGVVYIGTEGGTVYALNAATGAGLWTFPAGNFVDSSPAVANGVVYIGSFDGNVYALNAATGTRLWSFRTGNSIQSSPAVANGVVYIGSEDGNVYALDAATGARLWTFTTGRFIDSSPAVANGMVYIASFDHNVYAFGLPGGLATPAPPNRNSLHPDYNLPEQL
jgi:outer membrane protein assembly factor BamB